MWKKMRLDELFVVGSAKRVLKSQWKKEGIPFYRGREVTKLSMKGSVDNQLFITKRHYAELKKKYGVPNVGDIIITAIGTIGNAYIVKENDEFYFKDASVLWLKKTSNIISEYVNYFIKSDLFISQLDSGNGATVDTLTIKKLASIEIEVPTLVEQQRIVAKLDAAFAEINKIIKLSEVKDEEVNRLKIAFISSLVSDNNWNTTILGNVIDIVMGQAPPGKKCNKNGIGIPFVKAGEFGKISPVIREWTTEPKKYGEKSDIFLCVVGATCGKINYGTNCAIGRSVAALKPDCKKINQKFLYYFMSQKVQQLRKGSLGAAQTVISKDMINNLPISLPSLNEQEDIIIKLDKGVAEIDAIKNSVTKNKTDYFNLKNKILNKELSWEVYE
jgi:type I restriction enzyme S subunit